MVDHFDDPKLQEIIKVIKGSRLTLVYRGVYYVMRENYRVRHIITRPRTA